MIILNWKKENLLRAFLILLFFSSVAFADKWYVATAYDTEMPPFESGYSNTVSIEGDFPSSITFEWIPNTESDICGYHLYAKDNLNDAWTLIDIDIFHLDHCLDKCQKTLSINNPTIQLKGEMP